MLAGVVFLAMYLTRTLGLAISEVFHDWVSKSAPSRSCSLCLLAERREDAGDHPLHASVPAEVLHGEPGEPGPAAQKPELVPEPWGTSFDV